MITSGRPRALVELTTNTLNLARRASCLPVSFQMPQTKRCQRAKGEDGGVFYLDRAQQWTVALRHLARDLRHQREEVQKHYGCGRHQIAVSMQFVATKVNAAQFVVVSFDGGGPLVAGFTDHPGRFVLGARGGCAQHLQDLVFCRVQTEVGT